MADINIFYKKYNSYLSTFKKCSFDDDNKCYLCSDTSQKAINFDNIIKDIYPDSNKRPKSFDAIYVYQNLVFCIEFKNQIPSQIKNSEIREKIIDGKSELLKIFSNLNIQKNDYKFIYCVVYKECKEPYDRYKCGVGKGKVLFDLEDIQKNAFLTKVYTNKVSFFTNEFRKLFKKELDC